MEEKGGMVEDAKAEAVEPVAESPVEKSIEATPESAEDSSNEHSLREDAQTTPEAAEVLEEQEASSVDDPEGSQTHSAEEKQVVEDENDERISISYSPAKTASSSCDTEPHDENACATEGETTIAISNDDDKKPSEDMVENNGDEGDSVSSSDANGVADDAKPLDAEDGNQRRDGGTQNSQTQPNVPQSDGASNLNTCANDASEDADRTSLERSVDEDVGDKGEAPLSASLDATDSNPVDVGEEGNDRAETNSPVIKGPKSGNSAPPNAASPSCTRDEKELPDIATDGGSPETCPCVYVTSNLIGMSMSGKSGSEQRRRRRRRNSGLIDENYESSGHSKTPILGSKVDQTSMERVLPSSISPFWTPSRSPNRRRRRPGISPLHGATSDGDTELEISGKDDPSGNMDKVGTNDERYREVEVGEGGELINSTPSIFLAKHHSNHFLCLNLTGSPVDSETASSFDNQIINCPWTAFDLANREVEPASASGDDTTIASSSAGHSDAHRTPSTPSLAAMLDICYVIAAYQSLGSQNVACVYCDNGRTRTGVAIACYLKYEGRVRTSLDGFRLFCAKCNDSACGQGHCRDERDVASLIPPSLLQLFRNFDDLVDLQTWPNPQPLRLRAMTMQGVPVDDLPVVEIWSGAKGQIYNSHENDCREIQSELGLRGPSAQWGCDNEEGFYLVNKDIQGEFTITCRFGGGYADDSTHDPARILFRVTNHCAFFTWGPNELRSGRVDIMRRYAESFEDDFSLVLLFEPVGGLGPNVGGQTTAATKSYLPSIKGGIAAIEQGLRLITEYHSLQLKGVYEDDDDELTSSVARQIANNDDDSFRKTVASPQMVGVQNAIRAYKSRLAQNEKVRFNPMMPTSETSNAINTESTHNSAHNSANIVDQSNSSELQRADPRRATLSAIVSNSKDERNEGKKDSGDPRAALLSAIQSNGSSNAKAPEDMNTETNISATQKGSADPRAALLGAIKARKSAPIAENGDVDPRASMPSAIRTRQMPEDADEKSEKEEIVASPQPIDPRAAMLSAIKGRQKSTEGTMEEKQMEPETAPPLDPRAAMLSAIKSRQKPADNDNDDTQEKEEAKPSAPPLDPRAAMLSAIKGRQKSTEGTIEEKKMEPETAPPLDPRAAMLSAIKSRQKPADNDNDDTQEKEEAKPSAPPLDPRAAMLSAIKSRQKSTEGTTEEKKMEPEAAPPLDPRAAMLSAIKSRQKSTDNDNDDTQEKEEAKPSAPPLDPRAAMLSAIKSRQKSTDNDNDDTQEKEEAKPSAPPLDPRAAMLSAIKSRQKPADNDNDDTQEKEEAKPSAPPLDPRAAMLSAIKGRQKSTEGTTEEKKMEPEAAPPLDPRAAMLSAIKSRQKSTDNDNDDTQEKEEAKPSAPPLDPRAAMMSAIKSRQKSTDNDNDDTQEKEEAKPSAPPLDPRAAMLSAIKSRQKPADNDNDDTQEKEEAKPSAPPLDPRAAMLSAIKSRQKPADSKDATDDAPRRNTSKSAPPPLDPRAAMLSAIKSKKKPAEDSSFNKPKVDAASSPIAASALNSNDRLLTAMKARGTDDKSSQLLGLLDGIAFGCDDTMEPESNNSTSVASGGRFHPSTADYAPYSNPFTPSAGDVLKAFGSNPSTSTQTDQFSREEASGTRISSDLYPRPHLPLHPPLESSKLQPMQHFFAQFESREDIASCIELLDKMPRSGIQIEDLMYLLSQSRRWSKDELNRIQQTMATRQGAIADASLSREGAAANAAAALAGQFQIATDSSAPGGPSGPSKGALAAADAVSQRLENNASVSQIAKDINKTGDGDDGGDDGIPKLKDDPLYSKYFRMLKVGLPVGAVKNALQRDGQDPSIMDLDQNRPIQIQLDERNKYREFEMSDWM